MNNKLIYLYMENINNCFIDQGINFSPDFIIDFNHKDRILSIKRREHEIDFFKGSNVNQINLIVGKNGSGKSTILNLLGLSHKDREELLRNSPSWNWFAIYSNGNDGFILEGHNPNFIKNLEFTDVIHQSENDFYCLKIKRDNEYFKSIGSRDVDRRETLYMYHANYLQDEWYPTHLYQKNPLGNSSYSRKYIFTPKMIDIYKLLTDQETLSRDTFSGKNVKMYISKRNLLGAYNSTDEFYNLINKIHEKIYNGQRKMGLTKQEEELSYSYKEKFIIEFLEDTLIYIFSECKKDRFDDAINIMNDKKYTFIEYSDTEVIEMNYSGNGYFERKEYLLNIIESDELRIYTKRPLLEIYKFREIVSILEKLEKKLFDDQNKIVQNLSVQDREKSLTKLLSFYEATQSSRELFPLKVEFANLSSGEFQYIKHYSNLKQALLMEEEYINVKNVILLLDEPDANFHPEWSRKYIYNLVSVLEERKDIKFQVVITTHSPFMVSDIPSNYIICIDVEERNRKYLREVHNANFGLMSNFYDLIKHNFFMEQSIGEYANQVFKNLMTKIKEINDPAEEVSEKIKLIANEIELIDDPIIKGKVFDYFEEMTIENKRKEIIQQKIARLENEITSYKKELTDDKLR